MTKRTAAFLVACCLSAAAPASAHTASRPDAPTARTTSSCLTRDADPNGCARLARHLRHARDARVIRRGRRAVVIARSYLGVPYSWGGSSRAGVDCSGLAVAVYGRLGVRLAHSSGVQWHEGVRVRRGRLQPGDLVFFDGRSAPGHVGIYVGRGRFIHAPHAGSHVEVTSLGAAWYSGMYVGAVRPRL